MNVIVFLLLGFLGDPSTFDVKGVEPLKKRILVWRAAYKALLGRDNAETVLLVFGDGVCLQTVNDGRKWDDAVWLVLLNRSQMHERP